MAKKAKKKPVRMAGKSRTRSSPMGKARPKKKAPVKKPAARKVKAARPAPRSASSGRRSTWLDDAARTPVIDRYARQLESFIEAMADGRIDTGELDAQEKRLVKLMKEVEPALDDDLHAKVTRLLCELTAYDIMQIFHSMQEARPRTTFQG